jgi:hypothetical protein
MVLVVFVAFVVFAAVLTLVLVVLLVLVLVLLVLEVVVVLVIVSPTTAVLRTLSLSVLSEVMGSIPSLVTFFDGFKSIQGATSNRANPSTRLRPREERRVERATLSV